MQIEESPLDADVEFSLAERNMDSSVPRPNINDPRMDRINP